MDFISGLPKSKGKDSNMVVVDHLTKYAHILAVGYPFTAKDVAQLSVKEVMRLHGFSKAIISDRVMRCWLSSRIIYVWLSSI